MVWNETLSLRFGQKRYLSCDLVLGAIATPKPHGRDVVEMRVPRAIVPAESEGHGREKADGLCTHAVLSARGCHHLNTPIISVSSR